MKKNVLPQFLTEQEIAERLGVSVYVIREMRTPGTPDPLPFYKIGKSVRYSEPEVNEWLERRKCYDSHEAANLKLGA